MRCCTWKQFEKNAFQSGINRGSYELGVNSPYLSFVPSVGGPSTTDLRPCYDIHLLLPAPTFIVHPGMMYNLFQVTSDIIKVSDGSVEWMFKENICFRT